LMLYPGDVLYLPPRFPHHGIAETHASSTYSIGCRAPSASQIIAKLAEYMHQNGSYAQSLRYTDPDLLLPFLSDDIKKNKIHEITSI